MKNFDPLSEQFNNILNLPVSSRVNDLGGYGPGSEVIYEAPPLACPSVLVDQQGTAVLTLMSNGSLDFSIENKNELKVSVLKGHFNTMEKRETGIPSSNVWISIDDAQQDSQIPGTKQIASLMNPGNNLNLEPSAMKFIKIGDPQRAAWYCSDFIFRGNGVFKTAVQISLQKSPDGPVLQRNVYLQNCGPNQVNGSLWTLFQMQGTQEFTYNKNLWYDSGIPVDENHIVNAAVLPYREALQLKLISSSCSGCSPAGSTCDYLSFIGNSSQLSTMPAAVRQGRFLEIGAGDKLNRFATPSIAASKFSFNLKSDEMCLVSQDLVYFTNQEIISRFRETAACDTPSYSAISANFLTAAREIASAGVDSHQKEKGLNTTSPDFKISLPAQNIIAEYANSVWTTVSELYENCRAHGAMLADGIELGTRDRGQDMWPKMKEDPRRIRDDLVYTLSFMYRTLENDIVPEGRLTLSSKLHGMFPRQFPSRWLNRQHEIHNDNRPYTDSSLWLINSVCMYLKETGDISILTEKVGSIKLTDPEHPEQSGIIGNNQEFLIYQVVLEIFSSFQRHIVDSPYKVVQILYGDWCDPVDMFGTSKVGDAATRGKGRGTQIRLSAHLFNSLVAFIDCLESPEVIRTIDSSGHTVNTAPLRTMANKLRQAVIDVAWEQSAVSPGFINVIHELKQDGSVPDYANGETGYTLGSMQGRDYDGINRRELATQAFCLEMLRTNRDYLDEPADRDSLIADLLHTVDSEFYDPKLGLVMFSKPMANNQRTIDYVGRMGVLPAGTAENGEYHHCQVFMHLFRSKMAGQESKVWEQFKPILSVMRDSGLSGPFETPATSYISDRDDPHFGRGMYFGLSGSIDWIVEIFQQIAGVELNLQDNSKPDIKIVPKLAGELENQLVFQRIIHKAINISEGGGYKRIPFTVCISNGSVPAVTINGDKAEKAEIQDLAELDSVYITISL